MFIQPFATGNNALYFFRRMGDLWRLGFGETCAKCVGMPIHGSDRPVAALLPRSIAYSEPRDEIAIVFCTPLPGAPPSILWTLRAVSEASPISTFSELVDVGMVSGVLDESAGFLLASVTVDGKGALWEVTERGFRERQRVDVEFEHAATRIGVVRSDGLQSPQLFRQGSNLLMIDTIAGAVIAFHSEGSSAVRRDFGDSIVGQIGPDVALLDTKHGNACLSAMSSEGNVRKLVVWSNAPWQRASGVAAVEDTCFVMGSQFDVFSSHLRGSDWNRIACGGIADYMEEARAWELSSTRRTMRPNV